MSQYHVKYICYAILEISFHSLHLISLMGFIDFIKVLVKEDLYKALQWIIRLGLCVLTSSVTEEKIFSPDKL